MGRLEHEHILVTGGSRGIGAAIVEKCLAEGARVSFLDILDGSALTERLAAPGRLVFARADIRRAEEIAAAHEAAVAALGPVTGLVNNAAVTSPMGPFAELRTADLRHVVDVNFIGAFLCAREAARVLPRGGAIVNVSSGAATLGSPGEYIHYAATKAAVDTLTLGLSKELGPAGIRVNGVAPGIIRTEMHAVAGDPDRAEKAGPNLPLGRPGEPAEIAEAIAWLLSDAASYTTGATLRVAGGR